MKFISFVFAFVFLSVPALASGYQFPKQADVTMSGGDLNFDLKSPSCWTSGQPDCKDTVMVYMADKTGTAERRAYRLTVDATGLVNLSAERSKSKYDWIIFRGSLPGGCQTSCSFAVPATLLRLKEFSLWYPGNSGAALSVEGNALSPSKTPVYPTLRIQNPGMVEVSDNPFLRSEAPANLRAGCMKQIKEDKVCDCYVKQITTDTKIKTMIGGLYTPMLADDLYSTLTTQWWSAYMNAPMNNKDSKGGAILGISMVAGMNCASIERKNQ